jgi:hypothetical protein
MRLAVGLMCIFVKIGGVGAASVVEADSFVDIVVAVAIDIGVVVSESY